MSCPIALRWMGGSTAFVSSTPAFITTTGTFKSIFTQAGTYSISLKIKVKNFNGNRHILGFSSDGSGSNRGVLALKGSVLGFARYDGVYVSKSTRIQLNKWYHVVGVCEAGVIKMYLDGEEITTDVLSPYAPANNGFRIGQLTTLNSSAAIDGNIAEVKVYSVALTQTQASHLSRYGNTNVEPEAFYPLDDLPSTYQDTVGGATGTGTGTTYSPDVPTQLPVALDYEAKSSLSFDVTVPSYMDTGINYDTTQSFSLSIEVEIKPPCATINAIFSDTGFDIGLGYNSIGQIFAFHRGAGDTISYSATSSRTYIKKWVKAAQTFNSLTGVLNLFIDGNLLATQTVLPPYRNNANNFMISSSTTSHRINGCAKNARFWNTDLTPQQVRDLHLSNSVPGRDSTLIGEWKLNEGAGLIAYDSSGNGNDGTITGATWSAKTPSKATVQIGGNLVKNGDFSYVPVVNVPTNVTNKWIDGTAGGSTNVALYKKLFGWRHGHAGTGESMFDGNSLKLSSKAVSTYIETRYRAEAYNTLAGEGFELKPNTQYTVSFKQRTNYVSGDSNSGAFLRVNMANGAGGNTQEIASTPIKITTDETTRTMSFTTGATIRRGHLEACIYGHTGAATLIMDSWFKDIKVTEVNEVTHLPVVTTPITCP